MNIINEKKTLISIIGILVSLKNNSISIDESQMYLFSPRIIKQLQDNKADCRIIEIIKECCELEDIKSLIPNRLDYTVDRLIENSINVLKSLDTIDDRNWI